MPPTPRPLPALCILLGGHSHPCWSPLLVQGSSGRCMHHPLHPFTTLPLLRALLQCEGLGEVKQ